MLFDGRTRSLRGSVAAHGAPGSRSRPMKGRREMGKLIRDLMSRGVATCGVGGTAREAAETLVNRRVSVVVVTDERSEACGVISKSDILGCFGRDLQGIAAEDIMTAELVTVSPTASLAEAVELMRAKRIHQLVIFKGDTVERRKPVGIFTIADAVKQMLAGESV